MSIREWIFLAIIAVTNSLHFLYEMKLLEDMQDMNEDWANFCQYILDSWKKVIEAKKGEE